MAVIQPHVSLRHAGKNQTQIGAVLESADPYTATNGTCTVAYSHPYILSSWSYVPVGGNDSRTPTVDQIKNAIYTYGPVTTSVCADNGWDYYSGGVYAPTSNQCGGDTNHMVVLEGWDDSTQSWIVRNSWGAGWGENGYMKLAYDPNYQTSRVGEDTSWVMVQLFPGAFNKSSPANGAVGQSTSPTLQWSSSSGASRYEYCYGTANPCSNWTNNNTATSVALSGLDTGKTYYWDVRAVNSQGNTTYSDGDASAVWSFTTADSAPSAFNKSSPATGATVYPTSPTLQWSPSSEASYYEYCYGTTNPCSNWTNNGTATSVSLSWAKRNLLLACPRG